MKLSTKGALVMMAGIAIGFSACKKDSSPASKPTTAPSVGYDVVSSQVASNFSNALSGSMGGEDLNRGLTPSFGTYPPGASALCGFVADSNVHYTTNVGDTIKSTTTGSSKFYFDCLLGKPVGYTLVDAVVTTGTAPGYSFVYDVAQGYQIESLNTTATQLKVVGTLQAYKDFSYSNKNYKNASEHDSFVITDAIVDIATKGQNSINSGSATFKTQGTNAEGQSWNYTGVMTFIGNDIGKLVFEGHTFYVNLATGKIVTI